MTEAENNTNKINGVFSSQEVRKVGTGTTTRRTVQKMLWYCTESPDDIIEIQPLNPNYIPSGPKTKVSKEEFLSNFSPEPELYVNTVYPKIRELNKTIAKAERYRANGEFFSAEVEFNNALQVDVENVRANFGLGITYLERGETSKADDILNRLIKLDAAFEQEHKHLFNEFGISLRKSKMVDQSIAYYHRALELSNSDANLHHNLARAYFEKKDIVHALEALLTSLELNPQLEPSVKFLTWLITKQLVPESQKQNVALALHNIKTAFSTTPQTAKEATAVDLAETQAPDPGITPNE